MSNIDYSVFKKLPKLVVFDLDGTIWTPDMYMLNGGSPFSTGKYCTFMYYLIIKYCTCTVLYPSFFISNESNSVITLLLTYSLSVPMLLFLLK